MSESHDLPPDILEKIFQSLTIKTQIRCISVCHKWKSLITHQSFIEQSAKNSKNNYLFLQSRCAHLYHIPREWWLRVLFVIYSDDEPSINHFSVPTVPCLHKPLYDYFMVVGICNGLVCLNNYYNSISDSSTLFILVNPFINKYVKLPKSPCPPLYVNHSHGECILGFGFDSKNSDFIVVKVFLYYDNNTPWVELYSHNYGKWRRIFGTKLSSSICHHEMKGERIFVNEAIHWLICLQQSYGRQNNVILSFDLATKTFKELMLPEFLGSLPYKQLKLLKGGNSLALVVQMYRPTIDFTESFIFKIWVMKEYGNMNSWEMIFSSDSGSFGAIQKVIAIRNSGELVLQRCNRGIIFLDLKRDFMLYSGLKVHIEDSFAGDLGESLFLINEANSASLSSKTTTFIKMISESGKYLAESGIYLKKDS